MREYRYRLRFSIGPELGELKGFKKSREVLKKIFFEKLPLSRETGKNKFSFGPALAREHFSECEYADVWLKERPKKEAFESFFSSLPENMAFLSAKSVPLFFPSVEAVELIEEYALYLRQDSPFLKEIFEKNIKLSPFEIILEKEGKVRREDLSKWLYKAVWKNDLELSVFMKRIKGRTIRPEAALDALTESKIQFAKVVKKNIFWSDSSGNLNEI